MKFFNNPETFALYRRDADKNALEAKISSEEITLDDIYYQLPIPEPKRQRFKQIELQIENEQLIANPQTDRWIRLAREAGKKVVLISDMYLSASQIEKVALSKLENAHLIDAVFVSSEVGLKKVTGNLFKHVCQKQNIQLHEMLHIGDNPVSDVRIPKSLGIQVLPYSLRDDFKEALSHEKDYISHSVYNGEHARLMALLSVPFGDARDRLFYFLGAAVLGPALFEFSHWLADMTQKFELGRLHFMLREGDTFEYCFRKLYPQIPSGVMHASRQSILLPTYDDAMRTGEGNFYTLNALSIADFYTAFQLTIENADIEANKHVRCEDAYHVRWNDKSLAELVSADIEERQSEVVQNAATQKRFLLAYLKQILLDNRGALVDFGGRGTALVRLFETLPTEMRPHMGLLFCQHPTRKSELSRFPILFFLTVNDDTKHALRRIHRSVHFIEMLLNAMAPSCASYGENGPIDLAARFNREAQGRIIAAFRKGIDAFFSAAKTFSLKANTFNRTDLTKMIARVVEYPTPKEALHIGALEFDTGKGSSQISKLIDDGHLAYATKVGLDTLYSDFVSNATYEVRHMPWVQGVITALNPVYFQKFFGIHGHPNEMAIQLLVSKATGINFPLFIFGAGDFFLQLLPRLKEASVQIARVMDSRAETAEFIVADYRVVSMETAFRDKTHATVLIASAAFSRPIKKKIHEFAAQRNIDVTLISVD
ncbi:MAG: HAD-IA family hydrolase [Deltaproteobacteria bacterium]|nr:HAD-IA family hydrolase [Deltaproteobacteria bacterium]